MTIEQVADRLLCSPSKVSRMETGFRAVTMRDVRDLCGLYHVTDSQRMDLMELARESRKQGWWQSYDLHYATFMGLEADATSIDNFEVSLFPGLLQTADYALAGATHANFEDGRTEPISTATTRVSMPK